MKKQDIAILYSSYNGVLEMCKIFQVITQDQQNDLLREYAEDTQPNETEIRQMKAEIDIIGRQLHAKKENNHKPGFRQVRDVYLPLLLENFNRILPNS